MITYCTNIHPGESWDETFRELATHLPEIRTAVSPDTPFPVGLRLSSRAAHELDAADPGLLRDWMEQHGMFVPTINGFPFGSFHTPPVKERVYLPDWRHGERAAYTRRLAGLLDRWLPEGVVGSVSTVPVAWRTGFRDNDYAAVRDNLLSLLDHLDGLRQRSGKLIVLALEPEPGCLLETAGDVAAFFERMDFPAQLRPGLGVCIDCCHHAVGFEEPAALFSQLAAAGIMVAKLQVSSAPRLFSPTPEQLALFDEPCYLHQVVIRAADGTLTRYDDLPGALASRSAAAGEEWRIHFHVPVFNETCGEFDTTRAFIEGTLPLLDDRVLLEVETYSWDVLPPELRMERVSDSIIREIGWVREIRR